MHSQLNFYTILLTFYYNTEKVSSLFYKLSMMKRYVIFLFYFVYATSAFAVDGIILIGSPGSGKGTFSKVVSHNKNIVHISPGDLLRKEVAKQTSLGLQIQAKVRQGEVIDNAIVYKLVKNEVSFCIDNKQFFVLDAFPLTKENTSSFYQLVSLYPNIKLAFVYLHASDECCIERIISRLVCTNCTAVFNEHFCKPKKEGVCDYCFHALTKRKDDVIQYAKRRVEKYKRHIQKLLPILEKHYTIESIDTQKPIGEVQKIFYHTFNKIQEKNYDSRKNL